MPKPKASTKAATRESLLHDAILAECRARGLRVIHSRMDRASTVAVGAPDFVIALVGARTLWIECKSAHGVLRHDQAAWIATLQSLGHEAHVIRSIEEFIAIITPNL
jgi:hypothetical protein